MTTWTEECMRKRLAELEALNEAGARAVEVLERIGDQAAAELERLRAMRDGLSDLRAFHIDEDRERGIAARIDALLRLAPKDPT